MLRKRNFVEEKKNAENAVKWQEKIEMLARNNILYFEHGKCRTANLNLNEAKKKLIELNESLQKKCSNLSLSLDYVYNHNDYSTLDLYHSFNNPQSNGPYSLVLCLYNGEFHCLSSITIEINGEELSIDSRTNQYYEARKYNILLRSIIILISEYLSKDIKYIKSFALNPSSAYILMQHFGGKLLEHDIRNREFLRLSEEKGMPLYKPDTDYKELFKLYKDKLFDRYFMLTIAVELNEENKQKAYEKFQDLLVGEIKISC